MAYRESLAIAGRLAKLDPSSASAQDDLAWSQDKVGNAEIAQGNLAEALKAYQASLSIRDSPNEAKVLENRILRSKKKRSPS